MTTLKEVQKEVQILNTDERDALYSFLMGIKWQKAKIAAGESIKPKASKPQPVGA